MELNQDYSTGNRIVDEVGRINISGNIIPMVWFQAIRYPNGKPNVNAIIILADIVYWYRPTLTAPTVFKATDNACRFSPYCTVAFTFVGNAPFLVSP